MKQKTDGRGLKCIQAQGVVYEARMHIKFCLEGCTMIDGLPSIVINESTRDLLYCAWKACFSLDICWFAHRLLTYQIFIAIKSPRNSEIMQSYCVVFGYCSAFRMKWLKLWLTLFHLFILPLQLGAIIINQGTYFNSMHCSNAEQSNNPWSSQYSA